MKRVWLSVLIAIVLLCIVNVAFSKGSIDDYGVEIIANCWTMSTSMGGSSLIVPYLKVNVTNRQESAASKITVKVVFYNEAEKSMWSDETNYLVSSSDDPLKPGYNKTAFVKSSVGYRSKISEARLPDISAEVYINDIYYGQVSVHNTYSEKTVSLKLSGKDTSDTANDFKFATNDPYGVVVTASYWGANTGYTGQTLYVPYLKIQVTNQEQKASDRIVVKVLFMNESDNSVLDDETSYLVSYGDAALKTGYNKTAYIKAGVGYKKQISVSSLPKISAEIYINDDYYGKVYVNNTYSEETLNIVMTKSDEDESANSNVKVNKDEPYQVTVIANCWTANKGMSGTLYVPYLKLNVLNQSGESVNKMKLKVVYYNKSEKVVWSDESDYLVSSSDAPLKHGLSKTSFMKSSVGYRSQITETRLPELVAEVYLDDKLIGEVDIKRTYTETSISEPIKPADSAVTETTAIGDEPYKVFITTNCWSANTGSKTLYTPYLKIKVVNQQGEPASKINMKVVFYNATEKTVWSDETTYLVGYSDTPLRPGYGKVAYVRSSVGYRSKPSVSSLPGITAEVYINDELYGEVAINNTFDETSINVLLEKKALSINSDERVNGDGKAFKIQYTANCWASNTGLNGKTLYVPYLKINVTNQQETPADHVVIHVVFYNEAEKTVWSDETDYLIGFSDTALKSGFNKTAFIYSSVGYKTKPNTDNLPTITAQIFINDKLYDTVTIKNVLGN